MMKKKLFFLGLILVSNAAFSQSNALIIKFKTGNYAIQNGKYKSGNKDFDNFVNKSNHTFDQIGNFNSTKTLLVKLNSNDSLKDFISQYKKLPDVEFVEEDFTAEGGGKSNSDMKNISSIPNDALFNRQWGLYNNGTMAGIGTLKADADTDMELAWDIETGDPNLIIAVIDTGFRMTPGTRRQNLEQSK